MFGIPLGIISAVRKGTWVDHLARFVGLLGHSTPIFWLGTIVILIFYAKLGVIPGSGRLTSTTRDWSRARPILC